MLGAIPTTSAAETRRFAPPLARAPRGPTQTAIGTLFSSRSAFSSASSWRWDSSDPGESSWMTNASTPSDTALSTEERMKRFMIGSM